jgi:argininosuccinate lyase
MKLVSHHHNGNALQHKSRSEGLRALASSQGGETTAKANKLWGGRFSGDTDPLMHKYNQSLSYDQRMWREDIDGSLVYAKALRKSGIITKEELGQLQEGLEVVAKEWETSAFEIAANDEDIHTANERRLVELIGDAGKKLHTGRSRNDQVATDGRLWTMRKLQILRQDLRTFLRISAERAEEECDVLMPGFTHLQPAQTVRWSHWLLSHCFALQRDDERLRDMLPRVARLPLGSGALAGNPFNVDRVAMADELGFFDGVCPNSMDAVSDRDWVIEAIFCSTMVMTHLSRWAEDLIVYSTAQFGYVSMADAYSTGSSLMPQKKNPDALELLRGKAGRTIGSLSGILTVVKGTPTTYNKDLQEDKEMLFDVMDTVMDSVKIAIGVVSTMTIHPEQMKLGLSPDMLATDLAEYLVRKGMPFRDTHHVAGEAVALGEKKGCGINELSLEDLRSLSDLFEEDVKDVWSFDRSAELRCTEGGTAKASVLEQAGKLKAYLQEE